PFSVPSQVCQANFTVHMLQPRINGHHAVFLVSERESAVADYEALADDPRISHEFTLDTDAYGHVVRAATIYYPRREIPARVRLPDQKELKATVDIAGFINHDWHGYHNGGNCSAGAPAPNGKQPFHILGYQ